MPPYRTVSICRCGGVVQMARPVATFEVLCTVMDGNGIGEANARLGRGRRYNAVR